MSAAASTPRDAGGDASVPDPTGAGSSGGVSASRLALGGLGVVVGLYGAWLALSRLSSTELVSVVKWLVGGVVANDGLIALLSLLVALLVGRIGPRWVRGPVAAGLVVLGTATLVGVPVIGRFGERASNPTLLDRHYTWGWVALAVLVLLAVLAATVRARSSQHAGARVADSAGGGDDVAGAGGR